MKNPFLLSIFRGKYLYSWVFAVCIGFPAFSQQAQTITGTVTDADGGGALPGVNVLVQNTQQGTITDVNGNYSISASSSDTLIFTFVGYEKQEIAVGNQTTIEIALTADIQSLDEIVVVAYGTQKKETITGSISSIKTKEIKQSPAANLAVTLAGRLPGLTAIQSSGEPGRDLTRLYLRGQGTVNGQSPIILVDGVPRDITYIDPNEVESVTILKDASATAMFGVRGANGVILVTTKRGVNGKPEISFSAQYGLTDFTTSPSQLGAYDHARLKNESYANYNRNNSLSPGDDGYLAPYYSDEVLGHYRLGDNPELYPDNDWSKILMKKFVPQTRYNLNITGGGEYVRYFVNAGVLDQGGQWEVAEKDDYDPSASLNRYNFRSNIDAFLNKSKTLKTFLNVAGYLEKVRSPGTSVPGVNASNAAGNTLFLLAGIWTTPPVQAGPLTPDGEVVSTQEDNRPAYGEINRTGYITETRSNVIASFGLEQDLKFITPGLSTKFMMSFDSRANYNLLLNRNYERWVREVEGDSVIYRRRDAEENTNLSSSTFHTFESYMNFQLFLNYARTFGRHDVSGLVLYQQDERLQPQSPGNPTESWYLPFNLIGVSARATYSFDSKYFAEFNMGYNGSEQFSKDNRFGFFPSISAGWLISRENFLLNNPVLSLLKIRGSYGLVGNDQLGGNRFLYLDNIKVVGGGYTGGGGLGQGQRVNEIALGNPNISWEVAKKLNVGLEVGLFDDLNLSVDVFQEERDNMLIYRQTVSGVFGYPGSLPPLNIGKMKNHGYEIELNYFKNVGKDFSINSKLNFNYAKNKVEFIDEAVRAEDFAYPYRTTGYSLEQNFGYVTDGFWNSQQEIDDSELSFVGLQPKPGDLKFIDANEDKVIDERDVSPIGYSRVPQYTFGAAFMVNVKNLDISLLFQGVANVSRYLSGWGVFENNNNISMYRERMLNAWTPERVDAGEEIEYPALSASTSYSQSVGNSFWLENTSFVRLKNAEIGYTLPLDWSEKIGSNNIRFYANGLNLITWDKMRNKDFDPEIEGTLTYPITRVFNFGVNVTF